MTYVNKILYFYINYYTKNMGVHGVQIKQGAHKKA